MFKNLQSYSILSAYWHLTYIQIFLNLQPYIVYTVSSAYLSKDYLYPVRTLRERENRPDQLGMRKAYRLPPYCGLTSGSS